MFTHKIYLKAFIFSLIILFNLNSDLQAGSVDDNNKTLSESTDEHSKVEVKNKTIGSWWMWASGSGLIVFLIFAFSKEEESIYTQ